MWREGGELRGLGFDGLRGAAIRAHAEDIGVVDFEQGSGFVEQSGESDVVHEAFVEKKTNADDWRSFQYDAKVCAGLKSGLNASYLVCLGPLRALDDVKLDLIALLEGLVPIQLNGRVVDKDIRTAFATQKSKSLCIVEPLDLTPLY